MSSEFVIQTEGLGKKYRMKTTSASASDVVPLTKNRDFWALRDVSFSVRTGETLGVIGPNGAGKSTLLKILAQITDPSEGTAMIRGRVGSLLEVGAGFHQDLTGRENVLLVGAILGMRRRQILAAFDEIVEFSGVAPFIDIPVKRFSSGMYLRLAFSVAAHLEAEILLIDEALAVGDQSFREKCVTKLRDLATTGRTVLFVSHDPGSITRLCERAIVIDRGRLVMEGSTTDALRKYSGIQTATAASYTAEVRYPERVQILSISRLPDTFTRRENGSVDLGRPVSLQIELQVPDAGSGPNCSVLVEVRGNDLAPVTGTRLRLPDVEPGLHRLTCHFPSLRVAPGRFTFTVTLRNGDVPVEMVMQLCPFEVDGSNGAGPTWTWKYVEDATWEHQVVESAVEGMRFE